MEIIHNTQELNSYIERLRHIAINDPAAQELLQSGALLIDSFLRDAIELDVDAISDGKEVFIAGIMEHIEEAGVHSGDSACILPPQSLNQDTLRKIEEQTRALALELGVVGLMNVQFAVKEGEIYLIEVNPRASRTVPFVAKSIGVPVAKIAARVMAGQESNENLSHFKEVRQAQKQKQSHITVKAPVFPFSRFANVDTILGPEMKSTGEVMGLDQDFARAFLKAQMGAGVDLPTSGTAFISVKNHDKQAILPIARELTGLGFKIVATGGTHQTLHEAGIAAQHINKVREGRPHIVDAMTNGEIHLLINTTEGSNSIRDSYSIRRTALIYNIPTSTTIPGSRAFVQAIKALRQEKIDVQALQTLKN